MVENRALKASMTQIDIIEHIDIGDRSIALYRTERLIPFLEKIVMKAHRAIRQKKSSSAISCEFTCHQNSGPRTPWQRNIGTQSISDGPNWFTA